MTDVKQNTLQNTYDWFAKAVPEPKSRNFVVQYSVMLEEVAESLEVLGLPHSELLQLIQHLREGAYDDYLEGTFFTHEADNPKKVEFLDAMCDITVTTTGSAYMLGQDFIGAMDEVNASNWSKFDKDGNPIFNEHNKIIKGEDYFPPNLTPFVGTAFKQ